MLRFNPSHLNSMADAESGGVLAGCQGKEHDAEVTLVWSKQVFMQ